MRDCGLRIADCGLRIADWGLTLNGKMELDAAAVFATDVMERI